MKMTRKIAFVFLAAFALGTYFTVPAQAQSSIFGETQISFERAIEIARTHSGGGVVTQVDWQLRYGRPSYEIKLIDNGNNGNARKHEFRIDGITGEITSVKTKSTRDRAESLTQVTSARVQTFAQTAFNRIGGGTINEVEWERESRGRGEYIEFTIHHDGWKNKVRIDVATNSIIRENRKR